MKKSLFGCGLSTLGFYIFNKKSEGIILIVGLVQDGLADKSGLKPNDVLLEVNDKAASDEDLTQYLLDLPYNQDISIKAKRADSVFTVSIQKQKIQSLVE